MSAHVYVHGLCVYHEHAAWSALTMAAVDTPVNAVLGCTFFII